MRCAGERIVCAGGGAGGMITRRVGAGDYRVTAYQIDPPTLLWEVITTDVRAAP